MKILTLGQYFRTVLTTPYVYCECSNFLLYEVQYCMKSQNIMKHVCIIINKVSIFLDCNHVNKATRIEDNSIHKNENRVDFLEERNAFDFVIQHGRRDVRCIKTNNGTVL